MMIGTDAKARKQFADQLEHYRHHLKELVFSRTAELAESRDAVEAANHAKFMFLATMGHELLTPLNGIMSMTPALAQVERERHATKRLFVVSCGTQHS